MSSRHTHHLRKQHIKTDRTLLGRIVLGIAVIEPLMTLPQIYQIWSDKNADGVSLYTWGSYALASVVWFFYGFKIKDRAVITSSAIWVLMEGLVVIGVLIY